MPNETNDIIAGVSSTADSPSGVSPKDFIFRYLKYLPWVIICGIIGFTMAYLKLRYVIPIFRVTSAILIKDENSNGLQKDQKFDELFMTPSNVNLANETAILRSRPVLSRVATDLGLCTYYYSQGNVRNGFIYPFNKSPLYLDILQMADSTRPTGFLVTVLDSNHFTLNDDKTKYFFDQPFNFDGNKCVLRRNPLSDYRDYSRPKFLVGWQPLEQATDGLIGSLRVAQSGDQATILNLAFDHENVYLGYNVLNTLMGVYDSLIVEDKTRMAIATERFIDSRLTSLKNDLTSVEENVKANQERNETFDVESQSKKYLDNISDAEKVIVETNVKIRLAEMLYDYIGNKENTFKEVPISMGIQEPVLIELVTGYNKLQVEREANLKSTPRENPTIKAMEASLDKMRRDIREALLNVKNGYQVSLSGVQQSEDVLKSQLRTLPGKSMQFLNIDRQQRILEGLYTFLLQKKIESSISSASTISNSKVLEPALPTGNQISPDRSKIYASYLMMGLLIPIGIIVLIEVLKDKVNSRTEVEKRTGAPILGEIGHSEETRTSLVVFKNSRSLIAEQFRIVRTNLQYILGRNKDNSTILVTSSFSGEGKSFISTNMGAALALSGKKTVIMEFDIRKPKIISGLDLQRKQGITNYIIGKAQFSELLVKVEGVDNLYVIPCGPIPPNPAEILLDKRLDELMEEVKNHFEVVIMDTAPVGLVSDAISISRFANCAIYVIRHDYTFRKQLKFIDELYKSKKLPSLSLILNDVKSAGGYYGGYGYYGGGYGYGRASGYFEDDNLKKTGNPLSRLRRTWRHWFGG